MRDDGFREGDFRVIGNGTFTRTPCIAQVAEDCEHGERPGTTMVVDGDGSWICEPCARIAFPSLAAEASRLALTLAVEQMADGWSVEEELEDLEGR